MYTGFEICKTLKSYEKCILLREYKSGVFHTHFHKHIPSNRLSVDGAFEFLKTLIVKYSSLGDSEILRCYLNKRKGSPESIQLLTSAVEYPEPGVIRKYFSHGDLSSWYDEVIDKSKFRTGHES